MTGLEHYRIKRCFSRKELAKRANISITTIYSYENCAHCGNGETYLCLSNVLGVPIDELLRENFPEMKNVTVPRAFRTSVTANQNNLVNAYREANCLSFKALADRLGKTSRECGRQACVAELPLDKHVQALATYEGITPEKFITIYSAKKGKK